MAGKDKQELMFYLKKNQTNKNNKQTNIKPQTHKQINQSNKNPNIANINVWERLVVKFWYNQLIFHTILIIVAVIGDAQVNIERTMK